MILRNCNEKDIIDRYFFTRACVMLSLQFFLQSNFLSLLLYPQNSIKNSYQKIEKVENSLKSHHDYCK